MTGPRLALWGTFDVPRLADVLTPRLLVRELVSRLPGATVEVLAPREGTDGDESPGFPLDGGLPALSLGPPGAANDAGLAERFDLVAVTGDVPDPAPAGSAPSYLTRGLGPDAERTCPFVWLAAGLPAGLSTPLPVDRWPLVSVRDDASREAIRAHHPAAAVEVAGDPLLLAARHADPEVLARRRRYLAHLGWWPAEAPLVVQGDSRWLSRAEELASTLEAVRVPIVLLTMGPGEGDTSLLDALAPRLPGVRRPESPTLEEMQAALAAARAVVASSRGALAVARAFGVPAIPLGDGLGLRLEHALANGPGPAPELAPLEVVLDRVASLARDSAEKRRPGSTAAAAAEARHGALETAFARQGRLFAAERLRLAERVERLSAGWDPEDVRRGLAARDELTRLRAALAETEAKRAQVEAWLESNIAAGRQTSGWLDSTEAERVRLAAELDATRRALDGSQRELEATRAELARLAGSRLFRATAPLRAAYARLRRR